MIKTQQWVFLCPGVNILHAFYMHFTDVHKFFFEGANKKKPTLGGLFTRLGVLSMNHPIW